MHRPRYRDRLRQTLRSRALTVGLLVVAGLVSTAVGREVARYVAVRQELDRLASEIDRAASTTDNLEQVMASLKSATAQEGAARTRLNLQKPGEKVLVIPDLTSLDQPSTAEPDRPAPTTESNSQRWWKFLFQSINAS